MSVLKGHFKIIWSTQTGTIDRGRKHFFRYKKRRRLFPRKIRGRKLFYLQNLKIRSEQNFVYIFFSWMKSRVYFAMINKLCSGWVFLRFFQFFMAVFRYFMQKCYENFGEKFQAIWRSFDPPIRPPPSIENRKN